MVKQTFVAVSVAVSLTASASWASAQESATVVLRSGDRVEGQLVDLSGAGFLIRTGGQERQIGKNEVAAIDFTGGTPNQSDWDRLSSGKHVAILRDGGTVSGELYDIGGTNPLSITFKTDGGERELRSSEVARILFARPNESATPGGGGDGQGFTVSARQQWTPTGITVRNGEWLTIKATGEVRISNNPNDMAPPAGIPRTGPGTPSPRTYLGALIGRIGNGEPFPIGPEARFQAPGSGQLFLGVNDSNMSDNDGSFRVTVDRSASGRRRR